MGRKRKLSKDELLITTEQLLLEHGYEQFNFKLLSEALNVGRSTVYEYVSNKDELIGMYMLYQLKSVNRKCQSIPKSLPVLERLKKLLYIFYSFTIIHHILEMMTYLERSNHELAQQYKELVKEEHTILQQFLTSLLTEAIEQNYLKSYIPIDVYLRILFNSNRIPNDYYSVEEWSNIMFDLFYTGAKLPAEPLPTQKEYQNNSIEKSTNSL